LDEADEGPAAPQSPSGCSSPAVRSSPDPRHPRRGRSVSDVAEHPKDTARTGRLLILAAALLWSVGCLFAKLLKGLDRPTIAFYRGLFAGLALLPFVPTRKWDFRPAMVLCCLVFGAMTGLYIAAVKATTAANAIFLQCTSTFWIIPFSVLLLGERPDRRS